MSRIKQLFEPNKYFHIYQKAENGYNLFPSEEAQEIFFNALHKIINPYAKLMGYCLLPDHYHLLIKVKDEIYQRRGFPGISQLLTLSLRKFIRNYNLWLDREFGIKKKLLRSLPQIVQIQGEEKFKEILAGIHLNPLYHKLTTNPLNYIWSSYQSIINKSSQNLNFEDVIKHYGNAIEFKEFHYKPLNWSKSFEP